MLRAFETLIKHLILPPLGLLLLALIGLVLLKWRPRLGRILIALGLVALWLACTPIVADALSGLAERYPALDLSQATDAQAIVILGGGGQRQYAPEYGEAAPEPYLLERLAYGAYLSRKTGLPILVTGYRVEAKAMRNALSQNFGIEVRWTDDRAFDTYENARNSARILFADNVQRILLVTRASHMWRAANEFTDTGLQVIPAPAGVLTTRETVALYRYLPEPDALMRSYFAVYELVGEPVRRFLRWSHLRAQ